MGFIHIYHCNACEMRDVTTLYQKTEDDQRCPVCGSIGFWEHPIALDETDNELLPVFQAQQKYRALKKVVDIADELDASMFEHFSLQISTLGRGEFGRSVRATVQQLVAVIKSGKDAETYRIPEKYR